MEFKLVEPEIAENLELKEVDEERAKELKEILNEIVEFVKEKNGLGISASQLGIDERWFIARDITKQDEHWMICFNPKFFPNEKNKVSFEEGCLTYPGKTKVLKRPKSVIFRYWGFDENDEWREFKAKYSKDMGVVIQHETWHCGWPMTDNKYIPHTIFNTPKDKKRA